MVAAVWGEEANQTLIDLEWPKKPSDCEVQPLYLTRGLWVDVFRAAPCLMPLQIMNLSGPRFWAGGSGQKTRQYRRLPK